MASKQQIVDYWFSIVDECDLSVDASEAHERCWRCGYKQSLERCHIIPSSLGGEDTVSNLVLLCRRCHLENPNIANKDIMWDWLRAHKATFYNTFWVKQGMKEYNFIYGKSLEDEFAERGITDVSNFNEIVREQMEKTTFHFGHPYLNSATLAGVFRVSLMQYDEVLRTEL
ncbi:HNH endonuclease [Paenibacillus pasadenensis]|uniref:HNH endonuclease n=1 Tax=Paenibacillus pasadenensis TaxID=217090 RepID=UPI00203F8E7D|nr:HNH endonuclease signature motif containing protein [Paenibacillus pasadenensis]MCM3749266.1 HNH endonuclease [Paenibacillus pasadenensis]